MEYRAKKNLHVGEGSKDEHKSVKAGEKFECSEEYFKEHLEPAGLAEDPDAADERDADQEEREAAAAEESAKEKRARAAEKKEKVSSKKKGKDKKGESKDETTKG